VFLALAAPTLFAPLAGHLADRVQRKTLLIVVNAITALSCSRWSSCGP
jgi:MFS family permease